MSNAPPDRAVPNLPSRGLLATRDFYAALGFRETFRDDGWLILRRGGAELEFFRDADLDPWSSAARCSVRLADLDAFWAVAVAASIPIATIGFPRLHAPRVEESGLRIAYLVDPDGNQLALIDEPDSTSLHRGETSE